jgi:hypothetical protein
MNTMKRNPSSRNPFDKSFSENRNSESRRATMSSTTSHTTPRRRGGSTISDSSRPSQIDTNMLIQSAARSLLDGTSPATTPFSNYGSELAEGKLSRVTPTLRSLETKRLPPMPDEQDRKRFIVSRFLKERFLKEIPRPLLSFVHGL